MSDFSELTNASLDLLFIDGGPRAKCLQEGFKKVKSGGFIYLDNWDNDGFWTGARDFLNENNEDILRREELVDYVPAQVGVYAGLLIQKAMK